MVCFYRCSLCGKYIDNLNEGYRLDITAPGGRCTINSKLICEECSNAVVKHISFLEDKFEKEGREAFPGIGLNLDLEK